MPTRMSGTLTALRSDVPTNGGKSDVHTSGVNTGTTKGNLMKKILRALILWAFPELTAQAARLKLLDENISIVRNQELPKVAALTQRFNATLPAIEEWYGYGPAKWCEDTKKELGTELKYLKDHTDALRNHRERHDVRLQKIESILRVMGRL